MSAKDLELKLQIECFSLKILYEKLNILRNEIFYIKNSAKFFMGSKLDNNANIDDIKKKLKDKYEKNRTKKYHTKLELFYIIKKMNLEIKNIDEIDKNIKRLHQELVQNRIDIINLLSKISEFRNELHTTLKTLNVTAKRLQHFKEASFQVYCPSPLLHRRFRYNNIYYFINSKFEKFNIDYILSWDYVIGDTVKTTYNQDDNTQDDDILLIRGAFWSLELPEFIPLVAHEIAHQIYIKNPFVEKEKNKLKEKINKFISDFHTVEELINVNREDIYNLQEDIFCDIFAYSTFGDSYILSIFFEGLGLDFDSSFLYPKEKDKNKEKKVVYDRYNLFIRRDFFIIRAMLLIHFRKNNEYFQTLKIESFDEIFKYIEQNIFKQIYNFGSENSEDNTNQNSYLSNIYKKFYINNYYSYNLIDNLIVYIFNFFKLEIKSYINLIKDKELNTDSFNVKTEFDNNKLVIHLNNKSKSFFIKDEDIDLEALKNSNLKNMINVLWFYRLNKYLSKIKNISVNDENRIDNILEENIPDGRIFRCYMAVQQIKYEEIPNACEMYVDELIFLKMRTYKSLDSENSNKFNFIEKVKEVKNNNKNIFYTFGSYDLIINREYLQFNEKNKDSAKINENFLYKNELPYYLDRHAIISLPSKEDKERNFFKNNENKKFMAIVNINLDIDEEIDFEKVKKEIENSNEINEIKLKFFMSLGWEDIVLVAFSNDLKSLISLKKLFGQKNKLSMKYSRTETTFAFNLGAEYDECKKYASDNEILLNIKVRVDYRNSGYEKVLYNIKIIEDIKDKDIFLKAGQYDLVINKKMNIENIGYFVQNLIEEFSELEITDLYISLNSNSS